MTGDTPLFPMDGQSFKALFDTYVHRVHDYIAFLCKSDHIAEEVTQEVFIILWRKRDDLHEINHLDQYIFRIARNLAMKLLKRAASDARLAAHIYKGSLKRSDEVAEAINCRNVQDLVAKALQKLPPQPRKIYLLSRHANLNFDQIASTTGLSRHTVKNHLQKALIFIREHLVKNGYQPLLAAVITSLLP